MNFGFYEVFCEVIFVFKWNFGQHAASLSIKYFMRSRRTKLIKYRIQLSLYSSNLPWIPIFIHSYSLSGFFIYIIKLGKNGEWVQIFEWVIILREHIKIYGHINLYEIFIFDIILAYSLYFWVTFESIQFYYFLTNLNNERHIDYFCLPLFCWPKQKIILQKVRWSDLWMILGRLT